MSPPALVLPVELRLDPSVLSLKKPVSGADQWTEISRRRIVTTSFRKAPAISLASASAFLEMFVDVVSLLSKAFLFLAFHSSQIVPRNMRNHGVWSGFVGGLVAALLLIHA